MVVGCEPAAWMEMAEQKAWQGKWQEGEKNAKAALTISFFSSVLHLYQKAGQSLIKGVRVGGIWGEETL